MRILVSILSVAFLILSNPIHTQGVLNKLFPNRVRKKNTIKKNNFPVPGKIIKNMDEQELVLVIEYAKNKQDKELAFKAYFHLFSVCQDHMQLKKYKLDLADYCYGLSEYEKAALKYEEFCILYPGCQEAEYAEYKLILCTFYTSLEAHRDQADTNRTINFITHFLQKAKDATFISEAESIYKTCRKRLMEHEVLVFELYLKQQKFTAAKKRLEYMQENFKDIEHIEKYIEYLKNVYDLNENSKTRPFYFRIKLDDALVTEKEMSKKKIKKADLAKTVSFFVA